MFSHSEKESSFSNDFFQEIYLFLGIANVLLEPMGTSLAEPRRCNTTSQIDIPNFKCFLSNFPTYLYSLFYFGLYQDDTIHFYFESAMVHSTKEETFLKLLLHTNSQLTLQVEVKNYKVSKDSHLDDGGFQKHIFASQHKPLSLTLAPLAEQMLSLALLFGEEDRESVSSFFQLTILKVFKQMEMQEH